MWWLASSRHSDLSRTVTGGSESDGHTEDSCVTTY